MRGFGAIKTSIVRLGVAVVVIMLPAQSILALGSWSVLQPSAIGWQVAAMSGNGQYALTGPDYGRLYLTSNNNTVTEVRPIGNSDEPWNAAAINGLGDVMIAASANDVYRSTDYGTTWAQLTVGATQTVESIDISENGKKIILGTSSGRVFLSTDKGDHWAETQPAGDVDGTWRAVAVSADGSTFLATDADGGGVYKSTNNGMTWADSGPSLTPAAYDWRVAEVSSDGQIMMVADRGGRVYRTTNGGTAWTETQPAGNNDRSWAASDMSKDGQHILISYDSGRLFISDNGADTWTETQPAGAVNAYWYSMAISDEGTEAIVGRSGTAVYVNGTVGDGTFTLPDDEDGVSPSTENAAPNSGDGNNDGIADSDQANVASFMNPVTQKYTTLAVANDCTLSQVASTAESANTSADAGYNYPAGLIKFTASCGTPGYTTTVTQYYYGVTDTEYSVRKYNPTTNAYFTITDATKTAQTIGGQAALRVTYSVTDGSSRDIDGVANGTIVDPVGVASNVVGVPVTGLGGTQARR